MIFVTIRPKKSDFNIPVQNKVALRCDLQEEDIQKIAQDFFLDVCSMEGINPSFYTYEIFIKDNSSFYKLTKDNTNGN